MLSITIYIGYACFVLALISYLIGLIPHRPTKELTKFGSVIGGAGMLITGHVIAMFYIYYAWGGVGVFVSFLMFGIASLLATGLSLFDGGISVSAWYPLELLVFGLIAISRFMDD